MLLKKCLVCNYEFEKKYNISQLEWKYQKYCSRPCYYQARKGLVPWNKGIKGVMKAWNKGKKGVQIAWNKGLPGLKDDSNPYWKGDKVGYSGLHKWVALKLGKPMKCEHCEKTFTSPYKIHWANIDHKYKRNLKDWMRLCVSCHMTHDRNLI